MKPLFFFLPAVLAIFACEKHEDPYDTMDFSSIALDTFIVNNYSGDAEQLYFNEIITGKTPIGYDEPMLNRDETDRILKLIQVVYNNGSSEKDTVFYKHKIHGNYCFDFHTLHLEVDPDLPEIINLSQGIIPTGSTELDKLLSDYQLDRVEQRLRYPEFPWLTLYTDLKINMIELGSQFSGLPSVVQSDFNKYCFNDGNTIELNRDNGSVELIFSIGRIDCYTGCRYRKYWKYRLERNSAELVRTWDQFL